jgi:hypothetical protein
MDHRAGLEFAKSPSNGKKDPAALTNKKQAGNFPACYTPTTEVRGVGSALTARNIGFFKNTYVRQFLNLLGPNFS